MDYVSSGPDVNNQYAVGTIQQEQDIDGNTFLKFNRIETYDEQNLKDKIASLNNEISDMYAMLDAIAACKNGDTMQVQYQAVQEKIRARSPSAEG